MAAAQMGTAVLWRYPKPNGRNPPSGAYNSAGFSVWSAHIIQTNTAIETATLF